LLQVLNTLMLSFIAICLVAVQWVCFGYSFSFGGGSSVYGDFKFVGSIGVGTDAYAPYGTNIPHLAFWWFQ